MDFNDFKKNYNQNLRNNISPPILNKYERCKIISERTQQLSDGADPLIETTSSNIYDIAVEELNQNKLPFVIIRNINGIEEHWKLSDLKK